MAAMDTSEGAASWLPRMESLEEFVEGLRAQLTEHERSLNFILTQLAELGNGLQGALALELRLVALEAKEGAGERRPRDLLPDAPTTACFRGEAQSLRDFVHAVRNVFALQAASYDSEDARVRYCGALLEGPAASWFRSLFPPGDMPHPCTLSFESFVEALTAAFGDLRVRESAQRKLETIKQNGRTISSFAAEFRLLGNDSGFGEENLIRLFRRGLDKRIHDPLVYRSERPTTLEEVVQQCLDVESILAERHQSDTPHPNPRGPPPRRGSEGGGGSGGARMGEGGTGGGSGPMEIGISKLPLKNKEVEQLRAAGLCFICKKPGHAMRNCPSNARKLMVAAIAAMTGPSPGVLRPELPEVEEEEGEYLCPPGTGEGTAGGLSPAMAERLRGRDERTERFLEKLVAQHTLARVRPQDEPEN